MPTLKVAVTQSEPEWLDLAGTVTKTIELITEAAQGGARLIAFPECWITGYPAWIWARTVDFDLNTKYILNSLKIDSPEMEKMKAAARENSIAVVLGFSERTESHSLYISQAILSPAGELLMHRRKIKPTHMERTVFGDGSGNDLNNVVEIDFGGDVGKIKVGCLACWEHTQPLLKYHTYTQGEVIHVSLWPPLDPHGGVEHPGLWSMSDEGCRSMSQTYAVEGGGFVLHCTGVLTDKGIEKMSTQQGMIFNTSGGGGSGVIGPDGRLMTTALGKRDDVGLIFADLDLNRVIANRCFLDIVGHYSRPDLLWLGYDSRAKAHKRTDEHTKTTTNGANGLNV